MSVMAAANNYNEVYNAITLPDGRLSGDPSQKDPMFCWDTHFPERLQSRLTPDFSPTVESRPRNPRSRRNNRNAARFKTQPITFDEIKEVDEESASGASSGGKQSGEAKESLKNQFANFSKSMDGLVVAPFSQEGGEGTVGSSSSHYLQAGRPLTGASSSGEEGTASGGECALSRGGSATSATIQRQQFRQRRKKRHTKSIEEAPELSKTDLDSAVN